MLHANGPHQRRGRRVILHIGVEKTGTTSIQAWLSNHRERWERAGVFYPQAAGVHNHMRLARWAQSDAAGAPGGPHATFPDELAEECARTDAGTIVLSNEHCHSRLTRVSQISRLRDLLLTIADEIIVVVYLRRQDRLAVSLFSTALKMGHAPNSILPLIDGPLPYYYDFDAILRNWTAVFGAEQMHVRLFAKDEFQGGSLMRDFALVAGLPTDTGIPEPLPENESLTEPAQRFLYTLNSGRPIQSDRRNGPERRDVVELLAKRYGGRGMQPSREEALRFYEAFRQGNECVRLTWFTGRNRPIFDDSFDDYPVTGGVPGPAAPAEFADVFSYLWTCRTQQIDALLGKH